MSKYIKLEDALNCVNGYFLTGIHKAIESLPTIEVSEDCISREWVQNKLTEYVKDYALNELDNWQNTIVEWIATDIEDAPSVVPTTEQSSGVVEASRLDFVKGTIEKHIADALCGIFFTRNLAGDKMTLLDKQFGIDIEICYEYEYFEIFGLTDSEQDAIESFYEGLRKEA